MSKKVLLLTHCFPPYLFAESYLCAKRMGNIPGVEVDVITMAPFIPSIKSDNQFLSYTQNRFRNITRLAPPSWYKNLPFSCFESLFSLPDSYIYLNPLYFKYLRNLSQYDVVMTWSVYHSAHLMGLYAKKRNPQIPWLAHFSDPWVKNPFTKQKGAIKFINKYLENKVLSQADYLLFTSDEAQKLILNNYPECYNAKTIVVPHAFDETLYQSVDKLSKKKFIIRYVGNFYRSRQPHSLLKALLHIAATQKKRLENVQVEFIGTCTENLRDSIPEVLKEIVVFRGQVDYLESLNLMNEADLLLVIDAPFEESPFLPSKLIDYIGADKPIFGITPSGTSQNLLHEMGFLTSHPEDPEDIACKLLQAIDKYHLNAIKIDPLIRNRYSTETIGQKMAEIINKSVTKTKNC
jgi:glycosyltransferase involved in cell wall biosynthesis